MDEASANAVYDFIDSHEPLAPQVKEAVQVIENMIDTHGLDHVAISFNGGKDCTVLLHLFAAVLIRRVIASNIHARTHISDTPNHLAHDDPNRPSSSSQNISSRPTPLLPRIRSIYVTCDVPFEEVELFVDECVARYNLDLVRIGGGMKEALTSYLVSSPGSPHLVPGHGVDAMLIGTRRGDPHGGKLGFVTPTDPDWPKLLRVHPIIDWSYHDVWDFLRHFHVPYCSLYDAGYTSLGAIYNTYRNPALIEPASNTSSASSATYRPAYELVDGTLERAGRGKTDPAISNSFSLSSSPSPSSESITL